MVEQILLVLILQTMFFLFYYKFRHKIVSIIQRRICPVCFAVSSTWLTLILIRYLGIFSFNKFLITLLLAESVAGVANLVEEFINVKRVRLLEPLLKFGIVIYGTLTVSVFAFVQESLGLILFAPVIVFGFSALTPISKSKEDNKEGSLLLKSKLKNCC